MEQKIKASDRFLGYDDKGRPLFEDGHEDSVKIYNGLLEVPEVKRYCENPDYKNHSQVHKVVVGNRTLHVESEGDGSKETLILINGGPGNTHYAFHPYFSSLAQKGYRVIYYDQRGCGLSSKDKDHHYSLKEAADDLNAIRKALGIEKWSVVGHSYGGLVAQVYADLYSENIDKLILLSSQFITDKILFKKSDYITFKEHKRLSRIRSQYRAEDNIDKKKISPSILIYNLLKNGDWKRQRLFKPTDEEMAGIALYEWDSVDRFRIDINQDIEVYQKDGKTFNIPQEKTIIIEGKQDMTWYIGEKSDVQDLIGACRNPENIAVKLDIVREKYPKVPIKIFEQSAHYAFVDQQKEFFDYIEWVLSKERGLERKFSDREKSRSGNDGRGF